MKVKELTIQGFKSFVHRTRIPLHEGITVVVGPNGCGKSNILDALRWVMGEQRPLQLRGKSMSDMIFNGTQRLKPAGMAEVHLTMTGDGVPLPEPYQDYSEIMISRRLYRQGDTEYYLGKVPCRLKDITALFRDTGIGAKGYAFIEQGQISHIITAKPTDIRTMFEEAAGVSGFQVQRLESYRKIRESEENLERLNDIIHEVAKNLKGLQKQARQAKKYHRLQDQEKELDQRLNGYRFLELEKQLAPARESLHSWQRQVGEKEQQRLELTAELDQLQADRQRLQALVDEGRDRVNRNREKILSTRSKVELLVQEQETLNRQLKEGQGRRQGLEQTLKRLEKSRQEQDRQLEIQQQRWLAEQGELQFLEKAYLDKKAVVSRMLKEQTTCREEVFQLMSEESRLKNEVHLYSEKLERLRQRKESLLDDGLQLRRQLEELELTLEQERDLLAEKRRRQQLLEEEKEILSSRLVQLQRKMEDADQRRQAAQHHLTDCERQWHQLHTKVSEGFGFTSGMKQALQEESAAVLRSFWDVFAQVPPAWEQPLELFIRQLCEGLVLADHTIVPDFISRQRHRDRVAVLHGRQASPESEVAVDLPEGVQSLANLVSVKEEFRQVVQPLLNATYVVDEGEKAVELLDRLPKDSYVLTRNGEIYAGTGWFWVGNIKRADGGELLTLRRQLAEAERERGKAREQLATAEQQLEELRGQVREVKDQHGVCLSKLTPVLEEIRQAVRSQEDNQHEYDRLVKALQRTGEDEKQLLESRESLLAAKREAEDKIAAVVELRNSQEEELAALVARCGAAEEEMVAAQESLSEKKISLAAIGAKRDQLKRDILRISGDEERLRRQVERLEQQLYEYRQQLSASVERAKEFRLLIDRLEKEAGEDEGLLAEQTQEKENIEILISEHRETLREADELLSAWRPQLVEKQLQLQDLEHRRKNILDNFVQRYGTTLTDYLAEHPFEEGELFNEADVVEKLEKIRRWIENFGQVNLLALDEAEEVQQRYDFLKEQEADLLSSIQSVKEAIEKMEKTSRERFLGTFFQVNDHFSELFGELFNGGRASLRLTDEDNLWESGVEIAAAPPGKRLQNLRLFSGGEKALIAVSLIFAFFKVNPAPFCVLDEVDAPLDDVNIDRFNQLVKKFAAHSQFLIITHNRRTMTIGNYLYGITMEEDGVSKALSVQLSDYPDRPQRQVAAVAE
ncbi:MAG: chromosome segregation protein SMC [Deltaproteobacteria bacterium]|nr:MAG: chromosome segregation protein SMC [Deltaproteobacteria bacterium]